VSKPPKRSRAAGEKTLRLATKGPRRKKIVTPAERSIIRAARAGKVLGKRGELFQCMFLAAQELLTNPL